MEPGTLGTGHNVSNVMTSGQGVGTLVPAAGNVQGATLSLSSMDSYEDVFKEITKKLYGDESLAEVIDGAGNIAQPANIIFEGDGFRVDGSSLAAATGGMTLVTTGPNGLPPGTIVLQRRLHQDEKGRLWASVDMPQGDQQVALSTVPTNTINQQAVHTTTSVGAPMEERWFESDEVLSWTTSKIARYNPSQKVFRCVDCDFVGFLSRVAEHWLGNHASLRVFQCPRCPYTSAWARCVRMHLTRQHGETLTDNSLWKENPVLEEYKTQVTKFLNNLKTKVEQKGEANSSGEKRYVCPYCPYATDRRDLFNRHENIHRDEKPFQCYVCDKQFNRADHVKKHFMRMHRDHPYDINKIRKHFPKTQGGVVPYHNSKMANKPAQQQQQQQEQQIQLQQENEQHEMVAVAELDHSSTVSTEAISLQLPGTNQTVTVQQIPHIAYFNPPSTPGQSGPLQGIAGVGGTKKETKSKGQKKKKSGEKMYSCSYCPWQGVDNWCLKRHLNTHIKPFLCALCDYKAARSERLATHVLKVHNKRVCHKCSFLADDTESLGQHIQDSHQNPLVKTGFNCNVCQEYFELRADLEAHAILEHQKVIVQCDLCDFRTTDELSMEAHLRDKHNLQPGMGAVAAAAAAAAAAAIGQPTTTHYQMQLHTQPTMQISEQMQEIRHSSGDQMMVLEQSHQSNMTGGSETVTFQQDANGGMSQKLETGLQHSSPSEEDSIMEPEPEPETLCEKCGIEFADEASLKLHERRHEAESASSKENQNPVGNKPLNSSKKSILRTYVCSTCSYTAATKKLMMQHQRAHNGLELVCKAEFCLFSTPFDNTLKEHIHSEHGNEPNVRCPHCGLRMPSTNAFTYHWRVHHSSICSLCVNLYRIKYGIKENDLHELVVKNALDLLNDDNDIVTKPKPSVQQSDPPAPPQPVDPLSDQETQRIVDDLGCLAIPNNNNNNEFPNGLGDEPPRKKPRLDFSAISAAVAKVQKRESLKIVPSLSEVLVTPVISPNRLESNESDYLEVIENGARTSKRRAALLQSSISKLGRGLDQQVRLKPLKRYLTRGTSTWLRRNCRKGFKCHSSLCQERASWRYPRKAGVILHNLWHHGRPWYKCDSCDHRYPHLYQALMHKMNSHPRPDQLMSQDDQFQIQTQQEMITAVSQGTTIQLQSGTHDGSHIQLLTSFKTESATM